MKKGFVGLLCALFLANTVPAEACYGVRAMGMGGAFIAVADDVNTVYWNPAGLSDIKEPQYGWQRAVKSRDSMNYIDVYEVVVPLKKGWSGLGISYVNDRETDYYNGALDYKNAWTVLSYGTKINKNFAVGVNLRWVAEEVRGGYSTPSGPTAPDQAGNLGIDISFLGKSGKFSYGMLIQDANRPSTVGGGQMVRNTRPGIAYRPDARTVLAIDAYNLVPGEGDTTEWSYGVERRIGSHVRIRTGFYHKTWTYGLGVKVTKNLEINVAQLAGEDLG
ncbi:MAG TPA: hypothetical protein VN631_14860 [Negativicutes bacterium]|nr:hypothetical protein [Negativicutes bacterium]